MGLTPNTVAIATLVYLAYTFVAMMLFGSERWLERGEAFSVYFGMFASLAPLEVRDGRLGAGDPLVGDQMGRGAGLRGAGAAHDRRHDLRRRREGTLAEPIPPVELVRRWGSARWPRCGCQHALPGPGARLWPPSKPASTACIRCGRVFQPASSGLVRARFHPDALAYLVAHYFSLVVFQEQAQFTFRLRPTGDGSDYSAPPTAASTTGRSAPTRSGTSRSGP